MKLVNARYGFATNSSSSHSLLFVGDNDSIVSHETGSDNGCYAWDYFVLLDEADKINYLSYSTATPEDLIAASSLTEEEVLAAIARYEGESYTGIDHESSDRIIQSGVSLAAILTTDYAIIGGNDNDDDPAWMSEFFNISDSGCIVVKNGDSSFVSFNTETGVKLRFGNNVLPYSTFPELVDVKITNYCETGCTYCYQGSTKRGKHADFADIKYIIDKLREANTFEIAIGGGEPTSHPDFIKILKYAARRNVIPNFTTRNLVWLMNNPDLASIVANTGAFALSIDDVTELDKISAFIDDNAAAYNAYSISYNKLDYETRKRSEYPAITQAGRRIRLFSLMNIQVVLGTITEKDFYTLCDWASKYKITLTFLGYKTTGRGNKYVPVDDSWFPNALQSQTVYTKLKEAKSSKLSIGVDTCVIEKFGTQIAEFVNPVLFTTQEGTHSMYVDAVSMKGDVSSYVHGKSTQYTFDSTWQDEYKSRAKAISDKII